jgi:hypothetical protein
MNRPAGWILTLILLLPSAANAQAFKAGNLSGTYALSGSERSLAARVLCNGAAVCGGVDNATPSAADVAHRIAQDLMQGKCPNVPPAVKGGAAQALARALFEAGDERYFDGLIIYDGNGNITGGTSTSNAFSTAPGIGNPGVLNVDDLGSDALACGGAQAAGGAPGTCSAVCTAASLNCNTVGGYTVGADGRGSQTVYQYPMTHGICGTALTWDECCSDPTLVSVSHRSCTVSNLVGGVAQQVKCTITNQGAAGAISENPQ